MKCFFRTFFFLIPFLSFAQSQVEQLSLEIDSLKSQMKNLKVLDNISLSGYIQGQFEYGQPMSSLKVGGENMDMTKNFNRIGIRRGRTKLTYEKEDFSSVFQVNLTEKGINLRDAYFKYQLSKLGESYIQAGLFKIPFGYHMLYSSSRRETPEGPRVLSPLFVNSRDLGGLLALQASKHSKWHKFRLKAGVFSGNGVSSDMDNKKDFILRLETMPFEIKSMQFSGGASYYKGYTFQSTENVYRMQGGEFVLDARDMNKNSYASRDLYGLDFQWFFQTYLGRTKFFAEYFSGTQVGTLKDSQSRSTAKLIDSDTYIRDFNGGLVSLVQSIGGSPFAVMTMYDWYDPNTKLSKNQIGQGYSGAGDIAYATFGAGFLWEKDNFRIQAYYDWVKNEKTPHLEAYKSDRKDNKFTLRTQLKF